MRARALCNIRFLLNDWMEEKAMNNKPLAGLALVILLAMPLSALAEATAGEAVWTPPVVTAEEMERRALESGL